MKRPLLLLVIFSIIAASATTTSAQVFITQWGSQGSLPGEFDFPFRLAVDSSGNVFVAELSNNRYQKFDNGGVFDYERTSLASAGGITLDPFDYVWVAAVGASPQIVQRFSNDGIIGPFPAWGVFGASAGELQGPYGIAVSPDSCVYITDLVAHEVQVFDWLGNLKFAFGTQGSGPGEFDFPYDASLNSAGQLYVADLNNHRLQKFSAGGTFISESFMFNPVGVGIDAFDNVYVAHFDTTLSVSVISAWDSTGAPIGSFGTQGSGPGQFISVLDVAVDGVGNIFVVDSGDTITGPRIQKFGPLSSDANLVVSDLMVPSEIVDAKTALDVSYRLRNTGQATAGAFDVIAQLSIDGIVDSTDAILSTVSFDSLPAGADTTLTFSILLDESALGVNSLVAVTADPTNNVVEITEADNQALAPFSFPVPFVDDVVDVPGDQGGFAYMTWFASPYDAVSEGGLITEYTLWRALDLGNSSAPMSTAPANAVVLGEEVAPPRKIGSIVRMEGVAGPIFWELVDTHAAYYLPGYARPMATLFDSTSVDSTHHCFQVMAHTSDPFVFYMSNKATGRSVDNLAPGVPQNLMAQQMAATGVDLAWEDNTESDLANYTVHRGTDINFVPGAGNEIGAPSLAALSDPGWTWDSGYFYKVAAVDIHGNRSDVATIGPGVVTGVGDDTPRLLNFMAQNKPNPFNPTTTIAFGLKEAAYVDLRVYDAKGALVRTLVGEQRRAANYSVLWDGRNDAGNSVSTGVYFYRLVAGDFVRTRKMVLLK